MPIFTIVFERRNPAGNHDYQPLLQQLQAQKCFPLWENAWLGSFENNATQVHNYFKRLLAEADRVMVCEMTNHFCYSGVVQGANRWLELNPPAGGLDGAHAPELAAPAEQPANKAAPAKAAATKAAPKAPAKKAPAKTSAPTPPAPAKKTAAKPAAAKASTAKVPAKSGGAAKASAGKLPAKKKGAK